MLYTVYKTINTINNKIYIGFHNINDMDDILTTESVYDSIFKDGYLGSGKLIKRAIEKYGPENMKQELLLVTDDREEAEELERSLVNKEFVEEDTNYNLSIGGNVCIMFGENNGFYGKTHTKDTIEKIQESRNRTLKICPFSWSEIIDSVSGTIYYNIQEVYNNFNIVGTKRDKRFQLNALVYDGKIFFKSQYLQESAIKQYEIRKTWLNDEESRRRDKSEKVSKRFKGIPKSKESNLKRGKSISNWIKENPETHQERMQKINKNPEKIKKMAEKQTGKIWITNISTSKNTRHDPALPIPEGWVKGFNKKK